MSLVRCSRTIRLRYTGAALPDSLRSYPIALMLLTVLLLACQGGGGAGTVPATTASRALPYPLPQAISKIASTFGDRDGARASFLALDRGCLVRQLIAAGVEVRLDVDGQIRSSAGGSEAPLGRRVGRFLATRPQGSELYVSLRTRPGERIRQAPVLADFLDEVLDKTQTLDVEYHGQAFASATDLTTVSQNDLTSLILILAGSGYSVEQIVDRILLGERLTYVLGGPVG